MIYSTLMRRRTGNLFVSFLTITFLCLTSTSVNAQMFSIDTAEQTQSRPAMFRTTAGVGLSFASFTFQGDDSYESDLEFNNNLININFSTPGLDLFTTFGGGISGMENTSYLNVGARISNHFLLQRSENFLLTIPIQLSSDLTQVTSSVSDQDFRQSTLVAGTGLSSLARFTERLSLQVKATPNYGFSFAQGSLFGGSVFRMDGRAMLTIDRIFCRNALSVGYDFDYKSYNIDTDMSRDDYKFTSHTIVLGFTF